MSLFAAEGIDFYAECVVAFKIYFPHGKVDCRHCRFCSYRDAFGTYQCRLTEALIEKKDLDTRHFECPVQIPDAPF